jgi:hypothetical protein
MQKINKFFIFLLLNLFFCSIAIADEGQQATVTITNHSGKAISFTTLNKSGDIDLPMPVIVDPKPVIMIANGQRLKVKIQVNPTQTKRFIDDIIFAVDNNVFFGCVFYAKISAQQPYGVAFVQQAPRATSSRELNCAARLNDFSSAEFVIYPAFK